MIILPQWYPKFSVILPVNNWNALFIISLQSLSIHTCLPLLGVYKLQLVRIFDVTWDDNFKLFKDLFYVESFFWNPESIIRINVDVKLLNRCLVILIIIVSDIFINYDCIIIGGAWPGPGKRLGGPVPPWPQRRTATGAMTSHKRVFLIK